MMVCFILPDLDIFEATDPTNDEVVEKPLLLYTDNNADSLRITGLFFIVMSSCLVDCQLPFNTLKINTSIEASKLL